VAENEISFKMDSKRIPAKAFKDGVEAFLSLLQTVSAAMTDRGNRVSWYVTVEPGSAIIKAKGECKDPAVPPRINAAIFSTFTALEGGKKTFPGGITDNALEKVRTMASLSDPKTGIRVFLGNGRDKRHAEITTQTLATVDRALISEESTHGTVEGTLHTLSIKGDLHFLIHDEQRNADVRCDFPDETQTLEQMAPLIGKRISAWGGIEFGRHHIPRRIIVQGLRQLARENGIPPVGHFAGLLKGL
jgi:hypothetical protein